MAVAARNLGGPVTFVVDAQADLATIINPRVGQFALALAEGTLWYHTGSAWTEASPASASGAPSTADYLVGTANAGLSAEIPVGTTPGGELSGTWASPTVDPSHAGSTHAATQAAAEATAAAANTADIATHAGLADPHTGYQKESEKAAASGYASLDGTTKVPIAELPTGTSGTTVALGNAAAGLLATHEADTTSIHGITDTSALETTTGSAAKVTTHEAAADPHTGYLKEADVAAKGDLYVASANDTVGILSAPTVRQQRLGADDVGNLSWSPLASAKNGVRVWDEMLYQAGVSVANTGTQMGSMSVALVGTLSALTVSTGNVSHPGVISLDTGNTTTGSARLSMSTLSTSLGGGRARFGAWVNIPVLSVVAQRFEIMVGLADAFTGAGLVDAAAFSYIDTVSSGAWVCNTVANSVSTATATSSGITVAPGTWYLLEVEVNAAGTSVVYYIDGATVATHAANIPTGGGGRETGARISIQKSLGTTSESLLVDAYYLELDFTTPR